jgi:chorismate dehydratase
MSDVRPIRVGAVSYLNTKPLIYDFAALAPQATLTLDHPSRLADSLAAGSLDVALIPSVEFFQDATYSIVSNACIGCRGPVLSVKLFSRVPIEQIRTLALDAGSRTSAALTQVLLAERFGIRPRCEPLPVESGLANTRADAVLLIGDRAMHSPPGNFVDVWDLGDEWTRWTGLPFVFAMWTARVGTDLQGVDVALERARDAGEAHLAEIAAREAPPLGLTKPECLAYLRDNLHFRLEQNELQGLALFHKLAQQQGFAPSGVEFGCFHVENAR